MIIQQFYDKGLAHASYAIVRTGKMILIDPSRDPQQYYSFAAMHQADIVGVIETHPHADFVSSHLEIHKTTGAVIYTSKLTGAEYPHESFDDGDIIMLNEIKLSAINTPGHSPDSISVLVEDEDGNQKSLFTGDTLFVGDVGRPDLRENTGNITAKKEELAKQLFHSTRKKLMTLSHATAVYPAHGPGSLCGKNISPDLQSTIGRELKENYALQLMDELAFVKLITTDQPFVPLYFERDVDINKKGAAGLKESISSILRIDNDIALEKSIAIIDTRPKIEFDGGHLKGAINLQNAEKFETWLGSIIYPDEKFYLIASTDENLDDVINKAAKIGYEQNIIAAILSTGRAKSKSPKLDRADFDSNPQNYTVIDVRNKYETADSLFFNNAISIPLPELRSRLSEIPVDKPIVVHCAGGYRSAAAASIIKSNLSAAQVHDFGEAILAITNLNKDLKSA